MNFPMEEPLYRFIYWRINTPGIGGIIVVMIACGLVSSFMLTLLWIINGGKADFNIAIRTMLKKGNDLYFQVGGGIVAESEPEAEYEETLVKAKAIISSLKSFKGFKGLRAS